MTIRYHVVDSLFRNGGIISSHKTLERAMQALRSITHEYVCSAGVWRWKGDCADPSLVAVDSVDALLETSNATYLGMIDFGPVYALDDIHVCTDSQGQDLHYSRPYVAP